MSEQESTLDEFVNEKAGDEHSGEKNKSGTNEHSRYGVLPTNWRIEQLSHITDVIGGSTPSTSNDAYWGGGIPWATPTDITGLAGNTISETADTLTQEGLESTSTHLVPPNSVLMTSRATIGECAVNTVDMATNQGFKNFVSGEDIETWYLFYRMQQTKPFLESLGSGSTFDEVSKSVVKSVEIPVPPLSEQRKIASVLYTVDQAIEKTEEIIEQSDRLFRGIMNDIFEQGVSSPDRLQETPVGRFPQSWDIVQMRSILTEKPSYGIVKTGEGDKNGVKMIRAQDIEHGKLIEDEPIRVTKEKSEEYERTKISEGNVLLSVMGTVGRSMCATQELEGCNVNRALAVLEFENDQVIPEFADFWFRSPHTQSYFETQKFGTAQPRLNLGFLRKMKFPVPPLNTQKDIVEILSDSEQRYWIERETKNQLQRLKQGLMQDLLSGTVRTTDTNITVPDEVAQHG